MALTKTAGRRDRLTRVLLAVALTAVAIRSLRNGKRLRGALVGIGALSLGYTATTGTQELAEMAGIDATSEEGELRCAICGQPIRPGQPRGPNENDEIVHDACRESFE